MAFDFLKDPDRPELQPEDASAKANPVAEHNRIAVPRPKQGVGVLLGVGLGMAIAVGGMTLLRPKESTVPAPVQRTTATGQSVSVEAVKLMSIAQTFPAQGSVEARDWVSVLPRTAGVQIKEIRVKEGQRVEAGETIAVLDNSVQEDRLNQAIAQSASAQAQLSSSETQIETARAQQQSAQAQLDSAKAAVEQKRAKLAQAQATQSEADSNLRRYEDLANQGVISRQDLDTRRTTATTAREGVRVAQTDINSAQADVGRAQAEVGKAQAGGNQAQAAVNQQRAEVQNAIARVQELKTQRDQATTIQAPAAGIVAKKNVNVGDLTGTTALFLIEQNGVLELQAKVPETLLTKVRTGATAQITSDADRRIKLDGRVREVNPVVDDKTRQATVKIDLPASEFLKPGMFLKAAIAFETSQALTIPTEAVLSQSDGQKIVYVLNNDVVNARTVQVGDPTDGRLAVKDGLKAGEQVVTAGAGFLKDGDRVTVVK